MLDIRQPLIDAAVRAEGKELARREAAYRDDRPLPTIAGKTVILVDDGLATGSTMQAAVAALRGQSPASIVVAVPVAAPETCREFENEVDSVVCAITPALFFAVGQWYENFGQTTDAEVRDLLGRAARVRG